MPSRASKIAAIGPDLKGREELDARGLHLFPGVIDAHVHFNEPGRTEWEGWATGSRALAAGGGTACVEMPLNAHPPTLDGAAFDAKAAAASASSVVDFALWGGLTPDNLDRLEELAERGVVGFKAFMCDSGIEDFRAADDDTLHAGMAKAAELGLPVAVHAERPARLTTPDGTDWRAFVASRPVEAELEAIEVAIALAHETGCSLHVVHVSSGAGVELVARAEGVTCETCPHYLTLTEDDLEELGTRAKCAPPLRSAAERAALWRHAEAGRIAFVASDHSPCPPDMKDKPFTDAWGGIAGAQTTLGTPARTPAAADRRGIDLRERRQAAPPAQGPARAGRRRRPGARRPAPARGPRAAGSPQAQPVRGPPAPAYRAHAGPRRLATRAA